MAAPVHGLVLTAGFGTRLRPLTLVRAKPAIPVGGEPMIRRIIRSLASSGVTELVLNLHYLPSTITAVVGDGSDLQARVRYSWEQPRILGSAGGPRLALDIIGADTFVIVNGDTLTDLDLGPMAEAHARSGALVTLALVPNRHPEQYGGVRLGTGDRIAGFTPRGSATPSHHFIGVQIVQAEALRSLAPGAPASSIGGLYDSLIQTDPQRVCGFVCDAAFWDVGTPADYWTTSAAFSSSGSTGTIYGRHPRVSSSARVTRSIVWDDVEVGPGATLDECIVTDGVVVSPGSAYRRSILVRPGDGGPLMVTPLA